MSKTVEKTFVIDVILNKSGNKGQFYVIRSQGEGYFVWDAEIKQKISSGAVKQGSNVRIRHTVGKFPNVVSLELVGDQSVQENLPNGSTPPIPEPPSKNTAMFRCNALNNAVALINAGSLEDLEKVADRCYKWLMGG